MTSKKKLQVFVSSTYSDLREERQAAVEAILTAGHIPAGMELFAAGDQSQMNVINDGSMNQMSSFLSLVADMEASSRKARRAIFSSSTNMHAK
jgi:hypothetical protein